MSALDFLAFASSQGLLISNLICDGRIHRARTESHPRRWNGAYRFDGAWGWAMDWAAHAAPVLWRGDADKADRAELDRRRRLAAEDERRLQRAASAQAAGIVASCRFSQHPYLAKKGFEHEPGLVDEAGYLVIPMRDVDDYRRINSVQRIDDAGDKRFLRHGRARGSLYLLGRGDDDVLCEGYATGLTIRAGLARLYRPARVVVCFSAANLAYVAGRLAKCDGRRVIVADNDASGTGERYAAQTGLPWAMPPEVGQDANDWHQAAGVAPLAELLRGLLCH